MKKIKRFAAVLLAGIMALALLTACGGSGSDNPEFDAKVESAYLDALNKAFKTSFENNDAIRALAVTHITEKSGADSLTGRARCKTDGDETTVVRQAFVPLFYEAANTPNITPDKMSLRTLYYVVEQEIETAKKKTAGRWNSPRWVSAQRPSAARPMLPSALS